MEIQSLGYAALAISYGFKIDVIVWKLKYMSVWCMVVLSL